jgi:hypothetical protein
LGEDRRVAAVWIGRHSERDARATREALAQLQALRATPVRAEPLSISDSLEAVRALKARRERSSG